MSIVALCRSGSFVAAGLLFTIPAFATSVVAEGVAAPASAAGVARAGDTPPPIVHDRRVFQEGGRRSAIRSIPVLDDAEFAAACPLVPATLTVIEGSGPKHGSASVNRDGTIDYVPNAGFRDEDVFCFRVADACGRSAEACVAVLGPAPCVERNRRTCGSLLLYPEFQDQQGLMTLFTITQACCDEAAGGTWVELVYITGTDCTERNRTIFLTACDTLTFLGSTQDLGGGEGYMYAFAKSAQAPGATPIVSNRFIGNEIVFDALAQLSYSINAVAFRGIGPDGSLNDEDGDGVRDLDGVQEYEEAPSKILVPRFLGQDAVRGTNSSIVLIALSGGVEFDFNGGTEVLFTVFDDNENGTSVGYRFFCWKKETLKNISSLFLETSLRSPNNPFDDPDEIFGMPDHQAGWFTIDGVVARSKVETIIDPAIYAVLIERRGPFTVADLPFELCSQPNGDLLPTGVAGDATPGFPEGELGDNQ